MHKKYLITLFALVVISMPYLSFAYQFGGLIDAIEPCDEGLLLYVLVPTIGGGMVMETYMWFYGELPFAFYIPPHIGQWLLGDAGLTPTACTDEGFTVGEGFPIYYHGESF